MDSTSVCSLPAGVPLKPKNLGEGLGKYIQFTTPEFTMTVRLVFLHFPLRSFDVIISVPLVAVVLVPTVLMTNVFISHNARHWEGRMGLKGLGGLHKLYIRWMLPSRNKDTSFATYLMNMTPIILKENMHCCKPVVPGDAGLDVSGQAFLEHNN